MRPHLVQGEGDQHKAHVVEGDVGGFTHGDCGDAPPLAPQGGPVQLAVAPVQHEGRQQGAADRQVAHRQEDGEPAQKVYFISIQIVLSLSPLLPGEYQSAIGAA